MKLYRYIPLNIFEDMLKTSSLYFVDPLTAWEDSREGPLYRAMKTSEGQKKIIQIMREKNFPCACIQVWESALKGETYGIRCQCWCRNSDSESMWEHYSSNNQGLRIGTYKSRLTSLYYHESKVESISIDYGAKSIADEISQIFDGKNNIFYFPRAFRTKEAKFSCEEEVRMYVLTKDQDKEMSIRVPIGNLSEFLADVMVYPNADNKYVSAVRDLCTKYNIKFLERDY